jgi:hypothetical protein
VARKHLDPNIVTVNTVIAEPEITLLSASLVIDGYPKSMPPGLKRPRGILSLLEGVAFIRKEMAPGCAFMLQGDA